MKAPRLVILRRLAEQDVEQAIAHYLTEGGADLALRFIDALEVALRDVGRRPAAGSPRYALELDIPGLRTWPIKRFPYLVFHVESGDHVDVWRILHQQRDIPRWLDETD